VRRLCRVSGLRGSGAAKEVGSENAKTTANNVIFIIRVCGNAFIRKVLVMIEPASVSKISDLQRGLKVAKIRRAGHLYKDSQKNH
jgi:hypothetical protein